MSLEKKIEDLTIAITLLTRAITIKDISKDSKFDLNPYEKAMATKQAKVEEDNTLVAVTPSDTEEAPTSEEVSKSIEVSSDVSRDDIQNVCTAIMAKNRDDKVKIIATFAAFNGAKSLSEVADKDLATLFSKITAIKDKQK